MKFTSKLNLVVAAAALLLLAACTSAPAGGETAAVPCADAQITEKDGKPDLGGCTLRIAVENAYQPFNYIDQASGKAVGYDYDVFAEICPLINCKPEYIETSWDAMIAVMGGQGGFDTYDMSANGITITEERAQNVDFSRPYITSEQVLLVRIDESRFTEPTEFATDPNLLIGTQIGTTNYDASVALVGEDRVTAYDQFGAAVQALINGDVDAVMLDNVAGQGYVGVNADKVKITGSPVRSEALGFIYPKGSPLVAPIDWALDQLDGQGKLDELYQKWFKTE